MSIIDLGSRRELFVDRRMLDRLDGTMEKTTRLVLPKILPGRSTLPR